MLIGYAVPQICHMKQKKGSVGTWEASPLVPFAAMPLGFCFHDIYSLFL